MSTGKKLRLFSREDTRQILLLTTILIFLLSHWEENNTSICQLSTAHSVPGVTSFILRMLHSQLSKPRLRKFRNLPNVKY
jgi:hypothetical protein